MQRHSDSSSTLNDTISTPFEVSQQQIFPFAQHPKYASIVEFIEKWRQRWPHPFDEAIYNDLAILFNFAGTAYLAQHSAVHLFRLVRCINYANNTLLYSLSFDSHLRHFFLKFLPSHLSFPFSSKATLGCFIAVTLRNPQEVLTMEDIQSLIHKSFPSYQLVPGTTYSHPTSHHSYKVLYFEIEKQLDAVFNIAERENIRQVLIKKLQEDLPRLIRPIFMPRNQEEIYKNILFLGQEMRSTGDLPHVMISLDQQKEEEIVFSIALVYVSSGKPVDLDVLFAREKSTAKFVSERVDPVSFLKNRYPVMAHLFRLHIPHNPSFFRSDGTLHFYKVRRCVTDLLYRVLGEFRDYNGGLILKLEEQLSLLKEHFQDALVKNPEIIETFFYSIVPVEKQATLSFPTLCRMFSSFLEAMSFQAVQPSDYYFVQKEDENKVFVAMRLPASPFQQTVKASFEELMLKTTLFITWSLLEIREELSITLVIENPASLEKEAYLNALQEILKRWSQQVAGQRVMRIALAQGVPSLDPRIGSDEQSSNLLRMLFEGLTRFNSEGKIEGAIAESISMSADGCHYIFQLRPSYWNDGTPLTAYDFAYAWKKVLSPHFALSFAYFLYPIRAAQAVKEGKLSEDHLGIRVIDDHTLEVILEHPLSYFLELLSHPISFPIHQVIDQENPQWASEVGSAYPCNGPFQLMTSHPKYGYQLVKNPLYWDASEVSLDQMILVCVNSLESRSLFQQGKIDWLGYPFVTLMDLSWEIEFTERYVLSERISLWCLFNTEAFPFNHSKFRQALNLAMDSKELFRRTYPLAEFNSSLLPPHLSQLFSDPGLEYNPCQAKLLFCEFLEDTGISKEDFPSFTILHSTNAIDQSIAMQLARQWTRNLEIKIKVEEESWYSLYQRYKIGDFQIGFLRWIPRFNDPIYTLNAFRYSSGVVNFSKWDNPLYQHFLDQAENPLNALERKKWLKKAEELLQIELPAIALFHAPYQCLKRQEMDPSLLMRCGFLINPKLNSKPI